MDITTSLMEAFLKCRTKCYLRAREEVETGNAYAAWVRKQSDVFRSEGIKRLVAGVAPGKWASCSPAMKNGRQLATDFLARSENLQCCCHAVQRSRTAGPGQAAQFIPIRFVFTNKLTRNDKILLAFDALV